MGARIWDKEKNIQSLYLMFIRTSWHYFREPQFIVVYVWTLRGKASETKWQNNIKRFATMVLNYQAISLSWC